MSRDAATQSKEDIEEQYIENNESGVWLTSNCKLNVKFTFNTVIVNLFGVENSFESMIEIKHLHLRSKYNVHLVSGSSRSKLEATVLAGDLEHGVCSKQLSVSLGSTHISNPQFLIVPFQKEHHFPLGFLICEGEI